MKRLSIIIIILAMISVANADLTLTVNGLDTSMPVEVEPDDDISIAVAGQTDEQKESYSVTCEIGGKLTPLPEPNSLAEKPKEGDYLFTFEDEELGLAIVNLTVGEVLDYQLIFFSVPDSNIIIFGIDSDAIEIPEPEPEPEPNQPTTVDGYPEAKPRQTEEKVMYICPDYKKKDSKGYPDKDPNGTKWQPTSGGGTKDGGDVYINSDITTNTLWTKDNIYHITADVNVTALLVIEPGTIIGHSQGVGMFVNNGGAVIAVGNAEWPIVFTSDVFPHWYDDYYCGLYIEETASSATAVQNCIFEFSQIGVSVNNKRLQKPIKHNQFHRCVVGILEAGPNHTDIINNACFYQYDTGIEVYMEKMPESIGDADSHILIQGNTCLDYNWWGITVHGATDANGQPDPNNAGTVVLANNIVAWCYDAGLNLVDGAMYASVLNTGYYQNYMNKNWDFNETDPVEATEYPFQTGDLGYLSLVYLNPACPFINAGAGIVHQTGVTGHTTDVDGIPDSNITDIGFHWYHPRYENVGEGDYYQSDLDQNLIVDFRDFAILANGWLTTYDINDLADMCKHWLLQGGPAQNITPSFDKDPNNLTGDVSVTVNVSDDEIARVYMFVDGEKYLQYGDIQENPTAYLETQYFRNGPHTVKIITQDSNNMVYCSEAVDVNFGNTVSSLQMDESFTPGEDYHIMALGSGNYDIYVYDIVNETTTYSDTSTGQINIAIPSASFPEEYGAYDFKMTPQNDPGNPLFNFLIRRKFNYEDLYGTGGGAKAGGSWVMKMVVSIGDKKLEKAKEKCWRAALRAGVKKGFAPGIVEPSYGDDWFEFLGLALTFPQCKIWYHVGHGNYKTIWPWNPERTFISSPSGKIFSYLKKDLDPVPPDYETVWGYEGCHSIAELGFIDTDELIWVQINACYSCRNLDFAIACGSDNDDPYEDPIGDQVYIGWHDSVLVYDILGNYNQFEYDYWKDLRYGAMLRDAVMDNLPPVGGTNILENFRYFGVIDWQYAWFRHPNIN